MGISGPPSYLGAVYVKNLSTDVITRVDQTAGGEISDGTAYAASLSADGRYVAFTSDATNLIAGMNNVRTYWKDLQSGEVRLVSTSHNTSKSYPVISADGSLVAYRGGAPGTVYVKNVNTGELQGISSGSSLADMTPDGRLVAYSNDTHVYVKDMQTGSTTLIDQSESGVVGVGEPVYLSPKLSDNGQFIIFSTPANELVPGDSNGQSDVFVKDLQSGAVARVNLSETFAQDIGGYAFAQEISGDGRHIFFSTNGGLVSEDIDGQFDLYRVDNPLFIASGETFLGDDTLEGGTGDDILDGGNGIDYAVFSGNLADYTVSSAGGSFTVTDSVGSDGTDTLIDVEFMQFADQTVETQIEIIGTNGDDTLTGGAETNLIEGFGGDDTLSGGGGGDELHGGTGNDTIDGGADTDRAVFAGGMAGYTISVIGGEIIVTDNDAATAGDDGTDTITNVEVLDFADGDITVSGSALTGSASADTLNLGAGNEVVDAAGGDDTVSGGAGDDVIDGGSGSDTVRFSGNVADYTIQNIGDNTITVTDVAGTDGTDTVTNVEHLQFADDTLDVVNGTIAPIAGDDIASATEDTAVTILASDLLANDADLDGGTLAITAVSSGAGGTAALDGNGDVVFTSDQDFEGQASFTYTVSDGQGGTDTATVTVDVAPVNDAPTGFTLDNLTVNENSSGGTIVGNLGGVIDPDGSDTHSFTLLDDAGGKFQIVGTQLQVADGAGLDFETTASHAVTIRVTDAAGLSHDQSFTVQLNDTGEIITGTAGDDVMVASDQGDTLLGLAGNDTLTGAAGDDVLNGGEELLSKVVYGFVMRRRDPGVLHSRI